MKYNKCFKILVIVTSILCILPTANSGAITNEHAKKTPPAPSYATEGYFLYTPIYGQTTYLINETGVVNHTWQSAYTPNLDSYMLDNGTILLAIGSGNGGLQKISWNGTILWEYHYTRDSSYASHDVVPLPNGDVIMIMQEVKTRATAIQAGRNPQTFGSTFCPDFLIQVHPTGQTSGDIVWEWHIWDHLIQDYDSSKANYGAVGDHPESIDINFGEDFVGDWIHMNSVDYNPKYDQILMSAHNFDEVWIIDHSTSTEQAASHEGGMYGHGGDLLYRWGNPQAYRRGDASTKKLFFQHQVTWIKPGLPGAGNILVFANGNNHPDGSYSTVDEFAPPVNTSGEYYLPPGGIYGPDNYTWLYRLPSELFSSIWSGAQRMINGNTFICAGPAGTFLEVTPDHTVVQTLVNPYPNLPWNSVYRTEYIPPNLPPDHPKLTVKGYLDWTDIKPGATVNGTFEVQNFGDEASYLNWSIDLSSVGWGTWRTIPQNGYYLTPQDGAVTINVTCIAPMDKQTSFRGALRVYDVDNESNAATVTVVLNTPYQPPHLFPRLWQLYTLIQEALQTIRQHQQYKGTTAQ
jgi:hypothetical protein